MYQSTFYGEEDAPPEYLETASDCQSHISGSVSQFSDVVASVATSGSSGVGSSTVPTLQSTSTESGFLQNANMIVADESTTTWRETILDNISNLRDLTDGDNYFSNSVDISVHFTEDVGESGVAPKHIDPLLYEYKQGDFLNGYVLVKNLGTKPVPFDMFYVLFEGNFVFANVKDGKDRKPVKVRKFLEMFDFAASWNSASINRVFTDNDSPFKCTPQMDPIDGAHLALENDKVLRPGWQYKRFFTFKIPVRLLDSECNDHNLSGHTELPPTLGISRRQKATLGSNKKPINDFAFFDVSTNYGVYTRFIGKASKYDAKAPKASGTKLIDTKGDEFVVLKKDCSYMRILQESTILSPGEKAVNKEAARVLYENFVRRIKEKIEVGDELLRAIEHMDINKTVAISDRIAAEEVVHVRSQSDQIKARQLYTRTDSNRDIKVDSSKPQTYDIVVPICKKSIFGGSKDLGTLLLSTPKKEYQLDYISPKGFRSRVPIDTSSWKVGIPINLSFTPSSVLGKETKHPDITSIQAELIVFTVKSNNRPIPIELNHDLLFKNAPSKTSSSIRTDNFTHLVKKPMQEDATKLYKLSKLLGSNFQIEKSLVEDLSALSNVEEKYINLSLNTLSIIDSSGVEHLLKNGLKLPWTNNGHTHNKDFTFVIDVTKAQKKAVNAPLIPRDDYKSYDEFCLVPSFQTCLLSRLYYFRFIVGLSNEEMIEFKLPVTVAK